MGRRSGFTGLMIAAARASARASRQAEAQARRNHAAMLREQRYIHRENVRIEKENIRQEKERIKQEKADYLDSRLSEASDLNSDSRTLFEYIENGIITQTLKIDDTIVFDELVEKFVPPKLSIPRELNDNPPQPNIEDYFAAVGPMNFWAKIFKSQKKKWEDKIDDARSLHANDLEKWKSNKRDKENKIKAIKEKWQNEVDLAKKEHEEKVEEVNAFKSSYFELEYDSIIEYYSMVLERSHYDIEWNRDFKIAYNSVSKELAIEFELPTHEIVPPIAEYKYIKTRDEIDEKPRKKQDIEGAYKRLICSLAIRTIHEILESDQASAIEVISFNGYVDSVDPKTGKSVTPTLISISTTKSSFEEIRLDKIDPIQCIRGLSASFSPSPMELTPVKPIREFSMIDHRFVSEIDIASKIDDRTNLMDLDPYEFENLVSNLFTRMGLETKQTRSSRDGGVDAVAFDTRPVIGGKVVIQAKRYKNTVGVSAVRDLYGTMINEGACKGILVSTSTYGPDAYEFSKSKPLELIDGGGLLFLLNQVGIEAKIVMPDDN